MPTSIYKDDDYYFYRWWKTIYKDELDLYKRWSVPETAGVLEQDRMRWGVLRAYFRGLCDGRRCICERP